MIQCLDLALFSACESQHRQTPLIIRQSFGRDSDHVSDRWRTMHLEPIDKFLLFAIGVSNSLLLARTRHPGVQLEDLD